MAPRFGDVTSSLYLTPTGSSGLPAHRFDPAQTCFIPFTCLALESTEVILALWSNVGSMAV